MCFIFINFQISQTYYVLYILKANQNPYRRSVKRLATSWIIRGRNLFKRCYGVKFILLPF